MREVYFQQGMLTPITGHCRHDKMQQAADWAVDRQLQSSQTFAGLFFLSSEIPRTAAKPTNTALSWPIVVGQLLLLLVRKISFPFQSNETSSLFTRSTSAPGLIVNSLPVDRGFTCRRMWCVTEFVSRGFHQCKNYGCV